MTHGLGWQPDPPKGPKETQDFDSHDLLTRVGAPDHVPASHNLADQIVDVLDQGRIGSCVANAGMQALRMSHIRQGIKDPPLGSRLWGYFLARFTHGDEKNDSGTYIRAFFRVVSKAGFPDEKYWPYHPEKFAQQPPSNAYTKAHDQIAAGNLSYFRIYERGDQRLAVIRRAIAAGYPVVFGTQVTNDFLNGRASIYDMPRGNIAGGHAMAFYGYDKDGFDVVNSWGEDWGQAGTTRFTNAYVAWPQTSDLWIVETAPKISG